MMLLIDRLPVNTGGIHGDKPGDHRCAEQATRGKNGSLAAHGNAGTGRESVSGGAAGGAGRSASRVLFGTWHRGLAATERDAPRDRITIRCGRFRRRAQRHSATWCRGVLSGMRHVRAEGGARAR
jgi:hypothetical protein